MGMHPLCWSPSELPSVHFAEIRKSHPYSFSSPQKKFLDFELTSTVAVESENSQLSGGRTNEMQRLEAVLMLAREPLPSRKIAQLAHLDDGTRARTLIRKLNQLYDQVGRAFRVEEVAGGYQILTRTKFASWLRRLGFVPAEMRLSSPALETLAVVAYRQPVLKADIEAIRGVNCGEILRQLMERDLVRIGGRSEELGRPYLYQVTKRFFQIFGIRSLEDLPRAEFIRSAPLPPVHKMASSGHHTSNDFIPPITSSSSDKKESDVSVTITNELAYEETLARKFGPGLAPNVRLEDDDDDDFEDDDEDLDDEDDDDLDDDEDDDFDDDLDDEDDEDLEDEEWEEVDEDEEFDDEEEEDDDEDWDDEEEDDEDWDDEEDDDLDEDEEDLDDEDE
jgi:segregation and condensation protein B